MCGIFGEVNFRSADVAAPAVRRRMGDVLSHRGPDDYGLWEGDGAWLGHRRLSIIDLDRGHQPLSNETDSLWVVFNGEIYNYQSLRADLLENGHRLRTLTDTETIPHLYEDHGIDLVHRLTGMFAFALWDARARCLLLARDRLGEKPLYYYYDGVRLIFASEIKALLQHPQISRAVDLRSVDEFLTLQYIQPPHTAFAQIKKLPPAHVLVASKAGLEVRSYWQLSYQPKWTAGEEDLLDALEVHLSEAVRSRLIADVPVGAFLSGGIDSSLITALMARHAAGPVKTFSIGFEDQRMNELGHARQVARCFATEHHEFVVRPNAVEVLPRLIWHFDEPLADPAAIPTYYMAQMTAQHVKVALNGEGGDELFAGYERYLGLNWIHAYRRLPPSLRKHVIGRWVGRLPGALHPRSPLRQLLVLNRLSLAPLRSTISHAVAICDVSLRQELYTPEFRAALGNHDPLASVESFFHDPAPGAFLDRLLHMDVMTSLPGELLAKVDRMTMAHGLEGRAPFLDHPLAEFAARLPVHYKMRGLTPKYLLRKLAARLLPPPIARRRKQGFGVPLGDWFRNELFGLLHTTLLSDRLAARGLLQPRAVKRLLYSHQSGKADYSQQLWTLLNLELWFQTYIDPAVIPTYCIAEGRAPLMEAVR